MQWWSIGGESMEGVYFEDTTICERGSEFRDECCCAFGRGFVRKMTYVCVSVWL